MKKKLAAAPKEKLLKFLASKKMKINSHKKYFIFFVFCLLFSTFAFASQSDDESSLPNNTELQDSLEVQIHSSNSPQINPNLSLTNNAVIKMNFISDPDVSDTLNKFNPDVVTTDQDDVLIKSSEWTVLNKKNIVLVPYGALVKNNDFKSSKSIKLMHEYSKNIVSNVVNDKVGFLIVSWNLGMDVFTWMHATNISTMEASANSIYSILLAVVFGLDKERWSKVVTPINSKIKNIFSDKVSKFKNQKVEDLVISFSSSLILATAINVVRIPLVSLDTILDEGLKLNQISYPVLLSFISTLGTYTWSIKYGQIDAKQTPLSKGLAKIIMNFRSIIVGTFATTAALLNPEVYGLFPWATVIGSGGLGFLFYFKYDEFYRKIENSKMIKKTNHLLSLDFIENLTDVFHSEYIPVNSCSNIYL